MLEYTNEHETRIFSLNFYTSKQMKFPQLPWENIQVNHLTIEMAAQFLGVSRSRVKALIAEDRFRSFDKDGKLRARAVFMLDKRTIVIARDALQNLKKLPGGRPRLSEDQRKDFEYWLKSGAAIDWMLKAHPSQVPGNCRVCGRRVGTEVPEGGSGAVRVVVKHKPSEPAIRMKLPSGAVILPKCKGSGLPPKGWPTGKVDIATGLEIQPEDPRYNKQVEEMSWRPGLKA
jgi:hypothetical protein